MKVGILGTGDVATALGRGFVSLGHEVMLGSREPKAKRHASWLSKVKGGGSVGTLEEAARHGVVVVLAAPGKAAEEVLRNAGTGNFSGKLVIDVTNAIDFDGPKPTLLLGIEDSVGERVQRLLPTAKVVKALNTISSSQMVNPKFAGGTPEVLIAGNDPAAKKHVTAILRDFGWPGALDLGTIEAARWLEATVVLWFLTGEAIGRWDHAFKVVHG